MSTSHVLVHVHINVQTRTGAIACTMCNVQCAMCLLCLGGRGQSVWPKALKDVALVCTRLATIVG